MKKRGLVVVHGGEWRSDLVYDGGRKDYIHIPSSGITFDCLLSKLEVRLKKHTSMYMFDIDALVQSPVGESMRMKITDDYELSSLIDLLELPIVYVIVSPICHESRSVEYDNDFSVDVSVGINDSHSIDADRAENSSVDPPVFSPLRMNDETREEARLWAVPGAAYQASLPCEESVEVVSRVEEVSLGGTFVGKLKMTAAIGLYHLKNNVEFRTVRSSKEYYNIVRKRSKTCAFIIRATAAANFWRIHLFTPHSCVDDLSYHPNPKLSAKVVAAHLGPNFGEDGSVIRPKDIQGQLLRDFGVNVKYGTALNGKKLALNDKYGDADSSFQMLPKFLYMLEHTNPGTVVDLQTCSDGSFQYCYFALDACIRAFQYCRPVIVIDGTHLKGEYKGILFVAATKDSNEHVVPLAFGIGDVEDSSSWSWFLQHVRQTFGCPNDMLIVSDQHLSIKNAVEEVYVGIPHGLCSFHIQSNLKSCNAAVIDMFKAAANAYRTQDFEEHMQRLKDVSPHTYEKLMRIGPSKWAVSQCPVRKFGFGTSNAVEVLNARLVWARSLPICSLLEVARNVVQDWFYQRRTKAGSRNEVLTQHATNELRATVESGRFMRVEPISDTKFNVIFGTRSNVVDIASRVCSCRVFDLDMIPCSHATAAIRFKKESPVSYVHPCYLTATWREIYAADVMPIPAKDEWCVPPNVASRVVCAPNDPKQAGRPRKKRISCGTHKRRSRYCQRCGQKGHHVSTCPLIVPEEEVSSKESSVKQARRAKKCGICGVAGHTRVTCKDLHRFA